LQQYFPFPRGVLFHDWAHRFRLPLLVLVSYSQ
jgi:hypothetical protein